MLRFNPLPNPIGNAFDQLRPGLSNWLFWSVLINEFCNCFGNELRHLLGSLALFSSLPLPLSLALLEILQY